LNVQAAEGEEATVGGNAGAGKTRGEVRVLQAMLHAITR
jgi:ABC-type Na+ transport system ATPase subunit NatA